MTYFQAEANKLQETIDRVRAYALANDTFWADEILRLLDGEPDV